MADETNMYLLNIKKILSKAPTPTELPKAEEESVDNMLRYLNNQTEKSTPKQQPNLPPLSQQSYLVQTFLKQKSQQLGHLSPNKSLWLQRQLLEESQSYLREQEERNRIHSILNQEITKSIHQFDQKHNPSLPLDDINRQCQLFPHYIDFIEAERTEVSKPSMEPRGLDPPPRLVVESGGSQGRDVDYSKQILIELEEETEESFRRQGEKRIKDNAVNMIRKNPKFLKLFGTYIMYFVKEELRQDPEVNILDEELVREYQMLRDIPEIPDGSTILQNSLTKSLDEKELRYQLGEGERPVSMSPQLFRKVANKRSGETLKFHPKTFIMSREQLVYYGEDSNMKMLILEPQVLQLRRVQKEVGGFFSREKVETESFVVSGEDRGIEIEYNELEGSEIFKAMVDHFALKVYHCFCVHTETVESEFKRFLVNEKGSSWDFTRMVCSDPDIVEYSLPYFFKVVELRNTLKSISFKDNGLNFSSIQYILGRVLQLDLKKLNNLVISGNEIQNQGIRLYCKCFTAFKELSSLDLGGCNLNTMHIEMIALFFKDLVQMDIRVLDFSRNPNAKFRQTSNNIINILKSLKPKVFRISQCSITNADFIDFLNFRFNITEIEANDCGIEFSDSMVNSIIKEIEVNYLLKVITANGNTLTASNQTLLRLLERPQLKEIAIDFPPEFFTDIKNPSNQWVIVPL